MLRDPLLIRQLFVRVMKDSPKLDKFVAILLVAGMVKLPASYIYLVVGQQLFNENNYDHYHL